MNVWRRLLTWRQRRRTQGLIDENRRLLAERDRLLRELAALRDAPQERT